MNWDYNIVTHLALQKFYNVFGIKSITISPIAHIYREGADEYSIHEKFRDDVGKEMIGFACDIQAGGTFDSDYVDRTYHVYLEEYHQEIRDRKLKQIGI